MYKILLFFRPYLLYILGFIAVPFILVVLSLIPYITPFGYVYYILKPYANQVFGSKEAMWGYVGVLSAAIGILIGIIYNDNQRKIRAKNLIYNLYDEILSNISLLFTGEVERPFYYEAFEIIKKDYSDFIKNREQFREIRALYDELRYYQEIVKYFRLVNAQAGDIVTEKQLDACMKYIAYFESDEELIQKIYPYIHTPIDGSYQNKRDRAIKKKNQSIDEWGEKLKSKFRIIFSISLKN